MLVRGIEDNAENYTRFHLVVREDRVGGQEVECAEQDELAFAVEHRPGTLVGALEGLARAGVDLTKIESRPVPGSPWEYIFYVDLRFDGTPAADAALAALREHAAWSEELGRYRRGGSCK